MLSIDQVRLSQELETLATYSDAPAPAVTRVVFTPTERRARTWLKSLCREAGLEVRDDAIGNTFARWVGSEPQAAPVATGSHIDAIPNAGRYDGVVGVLGGLEAIRALQRAGVRPRRSIELILFTSEEPTRFGIGCLGSRMLAGTLLADAAKKLTDSDGGALDHVRRSAGLSGELEDVRLPPRAYHAFVELHIEQGPVLEAAGKPLGIVERIAAPASLNLTIEGSGGHAGGVLMPDRHDALCAAAELILALEHAARGSGAPDTVGTVGICDVFPGAVNSIPSKVRITADIRDTNLARRDAVLRALEEAAAATAADRDVTIEMQIVNADAPAESSPEIIAGLKSACVRHGVDFLTMPSRAYHDSLFMARIAPVAMLFIPCFKGYSHRPDEYASAEDIARGTLVLAETLAALAE